MESIWNILAEVGAACLRLISQPFYYIGLLLIILQYRRQIYLERKLFHTRLHSMLSGTVRTIAWGLLMSIPASLVMLGLGTLLTLTSLLWLWGLSLLFSLFRVRFMCYAYAAGALGLLHAIALAAERWIAQLSSVWLQDLLRSLQDLHFPSILALAAVMHLIEAVLVRLQGTQMAMPLFLEGKRGKVIGGYQLQGFWPVPLLLMVPAAGSGLELPWTPLFGGSAWTSGWTVLAFPIVIGFSGVTVTRFPEDKVKRSAGYLLGYGLILLGAAIASEYAAWLAIPASLICIVLHELMIVLARYEESGKAPLYVHDGRGLRVLGVIPNSPAAQLGIQSGEILYRINGTRVLSKEQLHQLIRENAAFIKIELLNRNGENKFVQRAMYEGEHHQLGMILAPDEQAQYVLGYRESTILGWIWMRTSGWFQRNGQAGKHAAERPNEQKAAVPHSEERSVEG